MKALWHGAVCAVYAGLLWLATPAYLWRLWRRGRTEPGYRSHLGERLGRYAEAPPAPGLLWLHAVSLGEARAALPLVEALRRHRPGLRMLFTHGTATGRAAGERLMQPGDLQAWLPYDTPGAVRRFLRHFRPSVGVLMETEIWPVLLREAERVGLPMVLANARLSERSARKGVRLSALLHPAVARLSMVLAQTPDDAQRLRAAGARQVSVSGNLKFDMTPPPLLLARGLQWRRALTRPVVMMASSREGEEEPLLDDWAALPQPRPLLLLVPRHPQRFDMVASLVLTSGLTLARRSRWVSTPPDDAAQADVWLGDTVGEMPLYYACSDVALLGGSFEPLGGQNLIEAAACGCPVIMGPHTFNFAQASWHAEQCGAARRVQNLQQGVDVAVMAVADLSRNQWVDKALGFAAAHRGAADQMATDVLARAKF